MSPDSCVYVLGTISLWFFLVSFFIIKKKLTSYIIHRPPVYFSRGGPTHEFTVCIVFSIILENVSLKSMDVSLFLNKLRFQE